MKVIRGKKVLHTEEAGPRLSSLSILVHEERCNGCGRCEAACSLRRTGRYGADGPAIRVRASEDGRRMPFLCATCAEAACTVVCPGDALSREKEYGPLTLIVERCSSCSSCILSCPFEVLHMGGRSQMPQPCDLCGGYPECVKSCPEGALELIDLNRRKDQKGPVTASTLRPKTGKSVKGAG